MACSRTHEAQGEARGGRPVPSMAACPLKDKPRGPRAVRGQLPPSVAAPSPAVSLPACTTPSPYPGTSCHPLLGPQLQPVLGALEGLLASFQGPLLQPHQRRLLTGAQGGVRPDHRGERLSWSARCSEALGMFVPATSVTWLEVWLASPVGPAGPLPAAAHRSHRLCPASVWC